MICDKDLLGRAFFCSLPVLALAAPFVEDIRALTEDPRVVGGDQGTATNDERARNSLLDFCRQTLREPGVAR